MAPAIAAGFGASIFMLIKVVVHMRRDPVKWAVLTAPFFFLVAGTICTLSVVYKGSPKLGLNKKPSWYVASVTMGTGAGVALLAAIFFVPYVYTKVIKRDPNIRWYHAVMGPLLLSRPAAPEGSQAIVPTYAVVQEDDLPVSVRSESISDSDDLKKGGDDTIAPVDQEKAAAREEIKQLTYKELVAEGEARFHAKLRQKRGPIGWAMRTLHNNPMGAGEIYERKNIKTLLIRLPAMVVVGLMYGLHYDIHAAQSGIHGTPEGARMERVYANASKYPNEVEHVYSFVQILTACTASFAHGANDIGNSVGPWAVIYHTWMYGKPSEKNTTVPVWQLAVLSATISVGLITYGYNIMKVMGNKITYHSPSRGKIHQALYLRYEQLLILHRLFHGNGRRHHRPPLLAILSPRLDLHVHHRCHRRRRPVQWHYQGS